MSTRCNILVGSTQFYHHYDGYPEGVGAELKWFLQMVNQGYFGTYTYGRIAEVLKEGLPLEKPRRDGTTTDTTYEKEKFGLHGDIEYLYMIQNIGDGRFSLYCIDVWKYIIANPEGPDLFDHPFYSYSYTTLIQKFVKPEYCLLDGSKATPVKINFAQGTAIVHTAPNGRKLYKDGTDKQIDKTISWITSCCQVMYYDTYYEKNHVMMEFGYHDGDPEYYFDVFNIGQKDGKNIIDVTEVAEKYPTQDFKHPAKSQKTDSKHIPGKPGKSVKIATLKIDPFLEKPIRGETYEIEFGDYNELRRKISLMFGLTLAPADQIHVFVDGKQIATVNFTTNPNIHRWWPIGETIVDYDPLTGALIKPGSKQPKPAAKPEVKVPKKTIPAPKPPVKSAPKEKPKAEKPKKEAPKKAISRPVKKVDPTKVAQIFEVRVGTEVKGQFTSKLKAEALKRDLKKNGMKPKVVVIHR